MKKILALMLALLLVVSLAACGSKNDDSGSAAKPTAAPTAAADGTPSGTATIANPWEAVSADEIFGYIGYCFGVPEGAENVEYFWNASAGIAEMRFLDLIGADFTARAKVTDAFEDIAGMYYDFASDPDNGGNGPDCYIWNNGQELQGEYHAIRDGDNYVNLGLWFYEGSENSYSFSLSTVTDLGFINPSPTASEVFLLEGSEDEAGVPDDEDPESGSEPEEYSREYWEAKYPGENICPFYIEIDGTEYPYFFMNCARIDEWVEQEFNWDGWHCFHGDASIIVNADETWRISELDTAMSFSSFCTFRTEKFDPNEEPEEFTYGEVITVKADNPLALKGLKLVNDTLGEGLDADYAMEGVLSGFHLNDWIEIYFDTDLDLNDEQYAGKTYVYLIRHRNLDRYADMDPELLSEYSWAGGFCFDVYGIGTEEWDAGMVGSSYVSGDVIPGDFDLLIYYEQELCYRMVMRLEPVE